jgi:hypothetical protein
VLLILREGVAAFALADVIRVESREAIEAVHGMGIKVAMLTGDSGDIRNLSPTNSASTPSSPKCFRKTRTRRSGNSRTKANS